MRVAKPKNASDHVSRERTTKATLLKPMILADFYEIEGVRVLSVQHKQQTGQRIGKETDNSHYPELVLSTLSHGSFGSQCKKSKKYVAGAACRFARNSMSVSSTPNK